MFCFYVFFFIEERAANRALVMCLLTRGCAIGLDLFDQVAQSVSRHDLAVATLPLLKGCDGCCTIGIGIDIAARAAVVILPAVLGAGCRLTADKFTVSVCVRCGAVVRADVTDHIQLVIVFVSCFCILQAARANLPVLVAICGDPITKCMRGSGNDQLSLGGCILCGIKVCITYRALIMCLHTCQKLGCGMRCGNLFDKIAVGVRCKVAADISASRAGCLLETSCFAISVRCKLSCLRLTNGAGRFLGAGCFTVIVGCEFTGLIATDGASCFLGTSCFTVIVRCKFTGLIATDRASCFLGAGCLAVIVGCEFAGLLSANGASCFLGTSCFTVIVRCKFTGLIATDGASCFLSAGCFAVVVSLGLTVSRVTGGANCLFGASSFPTLATKRFFVFCVVGANTGVGIIAIGCPCAKRVRIVGSNGQFLCRSNILFSIEVCLANGAAVMLLHTRCCAVCFGCRNLFAQGVGSCDLTLAQLPLFKRCNCIGASRIGIKISARATVVILPTVLGAGCRLTADKLTVSVRVGDGSIICAGVADHICFVIVLVRAYAVFKTAGADLPVLLAITCDPLAKCVCGSGNDEFSLGGGILFAIEVALAGGATVMRLHTCQKLECSMCCRNLGYWLAKGVRQECAVCRLTRVADRLFGAGCLSTGTIGGFGVLVVACALVGVGSVTVRYPIAKAVGGGIDLNDQLFLRFFDLFLIEIARTGKATEMCLHTVLYTGSVYALYLFVKGVRQKLAVRCVTLFAFCFVCAGCGAAFALAAFFVRLVMRADASMGAIAIGYPIAPTMCLGVDGDDKLALKHNVLFQIEVDVTNVALIVRFHTRIGAGCILLLEQIIVLVGNFANVGTIATGGIAVILKGVLNIILCKFANLADLPVLRFVIDLFIA